ncbi:acyl-CoA thioesterase-1 [Salinihabitans flavidus]|uniref:Acyl-CoA thioesterase-1 n=1 Tax=Salinihabitans flavidus TaxID=569882 RepID=A0A1H8SUU3_9RHOB|nr:arylesterase [Salinihabitans flavidus]SEO82305.1 acyl-CoA thioesterase-1 [Salinihabitans flavidus]
MIGYKPYGALGWLSKVLALLALLVSGPLRAEEVKIVALGDSLTQGYGLIEQEGFVAQLQAWLDARDAEATVVNAGVSGDTTAGGLSRVEWALGAGTDAMIVALGGNDMLRGIDPASVRDNLAGILEVAARAEVEVLLVGMRAPGNYGAEYKSDFDAIYPELAETHDTLYVESFFIGVDESDPAARRDLLQPDGIHPNAEGVTQIVEGLGPHVLRLIERARQEGG